jgi:hypothetical protein
VHLAQPVVVAGLVVDGDRRLVEDLHAARRALELHLRCLVGDARYCLLVGLADANRPEARGDEEVGALAQRPAGHQPAGAVVDEGHLAAAVAEHQATPRVQRAATHGDRRAARLVRGGEGQHALLAPVQVVGRRGGHLHILEPPETERRLAASGHQHVEALQHAEWLDAHRHHTEQCEGHAGARPGARGPQRALGDACRGCAPQQPPQVDLRQLR